MNITWSDRLHFYCYCEIECSECVSLNLKSLVLAIAIINCLVEDVSIFTDNFVLDDLLQMTIRQIYDKRITIIDVVVFYTNHIGIPRATVSAGEVNSHR